MRRRLMLAAAMAVLVAAAHDTRAMACSQCLCGSPTPPGYLLGEALGRLNFGMEERYLSKANALEAGPGEESQIEHRVAGLLLYRPLPRAAFQARLSYVVKKNTEAAEGEAEMITKTQGVGDAELLGRFDVWRSGTEMTRRAALAVVGVVGAPTGGSKERNAIGELLEAHLQPGTGAWSGGVGVAVDLSTPTGAFSASVLGRANGTNDQDFRYGNVVLFNVGYARALPSSWQAALELNGRAAERDEIGDGEQDPNSGGTLLYAAPSVRWSGLGAVAFDLLLQIPVAKNLNGTQTEKTTGRLALIWSPR
jgi:hypothetical protein